MPVSVPGLGQRTYKFDLEIPGTPGKFLLKASGYRYGADALDPTISRRKVSVVKS